MRYTLNRFVWVSTIRSRTPGVRLVNVNLLDHFLSFIIRELLIYVFLHVALDMCTRLQLCSTAQSSSSDSSLAGSSSRSVPAVPRQSSEPAGRSSPPGCHRLRYHVCLRTVVLECLDDASLHLDFTYVGVGPPTASRCNGPSVPWVFLPGPTGVPPMPSRMALGAERQPLWFRCAGCVVQVVVDMSCGRS